MGSVKRRPEEYKKVYLELPQGAVDRLKELARMHGELYSAYVRRLLLQVLDAELATVGYFDEK